MTSQQPVPEPETGVVRLQHLDFQPVHSDGPDAVYRAEIRDAGPRAPLYALKVTVPPPEDEQAGATLKAFLKEMEVGFVLTAPNTDDDTEEDQDRQPPDSERFKEVLFEPELVQLRTTPEGVFGVIAVVRTSVAGDEEAPEAPLDVQVGPRVLRVEPAYLAAGTEDQPDVAYLYVQKTVLAGHQHKYTAIGGLSRYASVTANAGKAGRVFYPDQYVSVGGGSKSVRGTAVYVRGGVTNLTYTFVGYFSGPT